MEPYFALKKSKLTRGGGGFVVGQSVLVDDGLGSASH